MKQLFAILLATLLMSCSGDGPSRVVVPQSAASDTIRIAWQSVEIREVTLPSYAAEEEIFVTQPDGTLQSLPSVVWADDPERAVTLQLARDLAQISGAKVASAPWPLSDFAQAKVEVRIAEFVVDSTGQFLLSGQYFVAPEAGRDRSGQFRLVQPVTVPGSPQALASARGAAIRQLAQLIAKDGLR